MWGHARGRISLLSEAVFCNLSPVHPVSERKGGGGGGVGRRQVWLPREAVFFYCLLLQTGRPPSRVGWRAVRSALMSTVRRIFVFTRWIYQTLVS